MTVFLVRHGSAGDRDGRDPNDDLRPLDDVGRAQARLLAAQLDGEPVARVVSSSFLRCVQSVEPLAVELGLPIETCDSFTEGAQAEDSWRMLSHLADSAVVICSHGDVIPGLIRLAQLRGMHIPGKSGCSKGSMWSLSGWDGTRFATGFYTPLKK